MFDQIEVFESSAPDDIWCTSRRTVVRVADGGSTAIPCCRMPLRRPGCKERRLTVTNGVQIDTGYCRAPGANGREFGSLAVVFQGAFERSLRPMEAAKGGSYVPKGLTGHPLQSSPHKNPTLSPAHPDHQLPISKHSSHLRDKSRRTIRPLEPRIQSSHAAGFSTTPDANLHIA